MRQSACTLRMPLLSSGVERARPSSRAIPTIPPSTCGSRWAFLSVGASLLNRLSGPSQAFQPESLAWTGMARYVLGLLLTWRFSKRSHGSPKELLNTRSSVEPRFMLAREPIRTRAPSGALTSLAYLPPTLGCWRQIVVSIVVHEAVAHAVRVGAEPLRVGMELIALDEDGGSKSDDDDVVGVPGPVEDNPDGDGNSPDR